MLHYKVSKEKRYQTLGLFFFARNNDNLLLVIEQDNIKGIKTTWLHKQVD
ncbi:hypothetical protein C2W64_01839 [Brevibacillus laterosporus]|nr:hypothetical protein C2W64_01839 [Brevibacillus laterosporus]